MSEMKKQEKTERNRYLENHMTSNLSSNTLFNFTESFDFLLDNLKNGIYCGYGYERLVPGRFGYMSYMTCFCDIPLSMAKLHILNYGSYAIGISRQYARDLGTKPVWYIVSQDKYLDYLKRSKNEIHSEHELKHIIPYLKQFQTDIVDSETKDRTRIKLYDENEWRYIPEDAEVKILYGTENSNTEKNEQDPKRMPLDLFKIEYIIIQDLNKELPALLEVIKNSKQFEGIQYETLVSKIMTANQIVKDF